MTAALTLGTVLMATGCAPADVRISGDTTMAPTTALELQASTSAPPTTPMPTAYPTIPPVSQAPPYWSPLGWTMTDVKEFLALVDTALYDLGTEHTVDGYNGAATLDNGTAIDLTLLAAQLTQTPRVTWKRTIDTYLESALSPGRSDNSLSWGTAQPMLRARVATIESLGLDIDQGVVQPIVDNLVIAACLEQDTGVTLVSQAQLDAWGRSAAQVIAIAIAQTLALPVESKPDGPFTTVEADFFASTRLLDPTTVVPGPAPNGYLVAIPTFGQFVGIPVGSTVTLDTITAMAEQAAEDFTTLENPASTDLYWWRGGRFNVLRWSGSEVAVPDELRNLLPS